MSSLFYVVFALGNVSFCDAKLMLGFEWEYTVPYDDTRNSGRGSVELDGITFPSELIVG